MSDRTPVKRALSTVLAWTLLGGLVAGVSACATSDGMVDKLYDSTRAYNRSLRWGDWDRAAEYIPQASADAFLDSHMAVEDELVVIDYEMTRLEVDKQNGIATSQVQIHWHTDRQLVVRRTTVDHLWQWHEGHWVLVDERRSGGRPLAIFAELGEDGDHPYLPGLAAFRKQYAIGLDPDAKRERERADRKAAKAQRKTRSEGYSLDNLDSVPTQKRPASFN